MPAISFECLWSGTSRQRASVLPGMSGTSVG